MRIFVYALVLVGFSVVSSASDISFVIPEICAGMVDSQCYLSTLTDTDETYMSDLAESLLPDGIEYFDAACQTNYRRSVCANVFRKCSKGLNESIYDPGSVTSLWNEEIYPNISTTGESYPLPFQRPCTSICANISASCTGLPLLFDIDANCANKTFDYSDGVLPVSVADEPLYYDISNNGSLCNEVDIEGNISSIASLVGVTSEAYQEQESTGACFGIVDYDIYIPSGNTVVSSLSKLQRPFAVQSMLEDELQGIFSAIPKWLDKSCYISLKKYVCSSKLKPSVAITISGYGQVYAPAYPNRSICEDYKNSCSSFLSRVDVDRLIAISPILVPQCDSVTDSNVSQYPVGSQVVLQLGNVSHSVPLSTEPNMLSGVNDSVFVDYNSVCPDGFVIPDNPEDPDVWWVEGSGCAIPCISNIYTESEWKSIETSRLVWLAVGIPSMCFVLVTYLHDDSKHSGYWYIKFIYLLIIVDSVFKLILHLSMSREDHFCRDNATVVSGDDGLTACAAEGFLIIFITMSVAIAWMLQSIFLYAKIVLEYFMEFTFRHQLYSTIVIFAPATIISYLCVQFKALGYIRTNSICLMDEKHVNDLNYDLYLLFYPLGFMSLIVLFCMGSIFIKLIYILRKLQSAKIAITANSSIANSEAGSDDDEAKEGLSTHSGMSVGGHGVIPRSPIKIDSPKLPSPPKSVMLEHQKPSFRLATQHSFKLAKQSSIKFVETSSLAFKTSVRLSLQPIVDVVVLLRPILTFVFVMWLMIALTLLPRLIGSESVNNDRDAAYIEWYECIFSNNFTVDDMGMENAHDNCGRHVGTRQSVFASVVFAIGTIGGLLYGFVDIRQSLLYWLRHYSFYFDWDSWQRKNNNKSVASGDTEGVITTHTLENKYRFQGSRDSEQMFVKVSHFEQCELDELERFYPGIGSGEMLSASQHGASGQSGESDLPPGIGSFARSHSDVSLSLARGPLLARKQRSGHFLHKKVGGRNKSMSGMDYTKAFSIIDEELSIQNDRRDLVVPIESDKVQAFMILDDEPREL